MSTAGGLLRQARTRAALSQRELARRAGTAQSVIARIERGQTSPTLETLERLLAAAGVELHASLAVKERDTRSHMLDDVPRILSLTPEQRLEELKNFSRFLYEARRG
jgi:transcriptional regulator with XRE-family HTH domain